MGKKTVIVVSLPFKKNSLGNVQIKEKVTKEKLSSFEMSIVNPKREYRAEKIIIWDNIQFVFNNHHLVLV